MSASTLAFRLTSPIQPRTRSARLGAEGDTGSEGAKRLTPCLSAEEDVVAGEGEKSQANLASSSRHHRPSTKLGSPKAGMFQFLQFQSRRKILFQSFFAAQPPRVSVVFAFSRN